MQFLKKYRIAIAAAVVIILGIIILSIGWDRLHPLPVNTTFKSTQYQFDYPRTYTAREYDAGVVSIGTEKDNTLTPYIEVTRYQSDPDVKTPESFDAFIKRQAAALCGADGSIESVTCTQIGVTAYKNALGVDGSKLDLTLVRKNLKTGTTTTSTYGPMYVFNTTDAPTLEAPLRYSAVFIYPSLSAFLNGTTTPELEQQIVSTFMVPAGATSTIK